ncbi:MAG: hypothetical protein LLG04_01460 [Parachlamydia sp.]|nr:hypothetical protein [Parachlamydia sp.]
MPGAESKAISSSTSASPSPVGTPQGSEEASLSGRKIIYLPADAKNRSNFEKIGIKWLESVDKGKLLTKASLPEGWEAIDTPSPYHHFYTLYDQNKLPKVDVFVKSDPHDPKTRVTFFTPEESERKKRMDNEEKKRKEEEDVKRLEMVKEIRSKRSDVWSKECPFGVFFVLNLKDQPRYTATISAQRHSCQGFFQTEEIANQAKKVLEKQAGLSDSIFVQKVDPSNLHLVKKGGYEIVDGFTNSNWWEKEGGFAFGPAKKISKLGE